jgi:NADH:ubiquinone oxidoreductase subunit 3 (subunit A)
MKTVTLTLIIIGAVLAQVLTFFAVMLISRRRARRETKEKDE